MKFLIKYATRGRPELFRKTLMNIIHSVNDPDFNIIVSADLDDPLMERTFGFTKQFRQVIFIEGNSKSKIDAINRDLNFATDMQWDILINMSDDFKFIVNGWDSIMKKEIKKVFGDSLDFFAHFNDGFVAEALPTMSIMGRKYYERDNYIYHPSYKSFSCDAEAMYVAMMREKYHYFPQVLFNHEHPANNRMVPNDATYIRSSKHTAHDEKNYFERLSRYFDEPSGHEILKARPELKKYL